jgi:short-subunit dehydrogenase
MTTAHEKWHIRYGPWAIVTGASDGIGRELARGLAQRGLNLVLVARRRPALEQLATELAESHGIKTHIINADLSDDSEVQNLLAATDSFKVGLLVASAGFGTSGSFIEMPLERELDMLDVNCRAVVAMSHHWGQRFAAQGHGGIILLSSLVAFQGVPRSTTYAATKAFVQSFAEGLHLELAPFGVDVLASAPGPVESGFATRANMHMSMALKPAEVAQETLNALGKRGTVRPGWLSKLLEGSLAFLPRWGRSRVMQQVMKGMTEHQQPHSNALSREAK